MTGYFTPDPLLADARVRAHAGAWPDVLEILEPVATSRASESEYATLFGAALIHTGRVRDARAWLEAVEELLASQPDRAAHRAVTNMLGAACFALGDLDDAARAFDAALDLAQRSDDVLLVARASNNLGALANLQGDRDRALWLYELAIAAYQRLGQPRGLAESYHNLAITYRDLAMIERADECERRAVEHAGEANDPRLAAMARLGRAEIALRRGDPLLAEATARRAASELHALGDRSTEADALRVAGAACTAQKRWQDARDAFAEALAMARDGSYALVEAETLRDKARLEAAQGRPSEARISARAALAVFRRIGATGECTELERWMEEELGATPR